MNLAAALIYWVIVVLWITVLGTDAPTRDNSTGTDKSVFSQFGASEPRSAS
jgi:hypothetical protein